MKIELNQSQYYTVLDTLYETFDEEAAMLPTDTQHLEDLLSAITAFELSTLSEHPSRAVVITEVLKSKKTIIDNLKKQL